MAKSAIQRATPSDAEALATLCREVQDWHAATLHHRFNLDVSLVALADFMKNWLAKPNITAWLAIHKDDPAGHLVAERQSRDHGLFKPASQTLLIEHIGVTKSARRLGLGRALLQAAQDHAAQHSIPNLKLNTYALNTDAQALFAATGFAVERLTLTKAT